MMLMIDAVLHFFIFSKSQIYAKKRHTERNIDEMEI
jgi:hypothetical protein